MLVNSWGCATRYAQTVLARFPELPAFLSHARRRLKAKNEKWIQRLLLNLCMYQNGVFGSIFPNVGVQRPLSGVCCIDKLGGYLD